MHNKLHTVFLVFVHIFHFALVFTMYALIICSRCHIFPFDWLFFISNVISWDVQTFVCLFYLYYSFVVKGLVRATLYFAYFICLLLSFFLSEVYGFLFSGAAVVNVDIVDGRLC